MKPRNVVAWSCAVFFAFALGMFGYFLFMDLRYSSFPRLEALLGIRNPIIQAILVAVAAAIPSTFLVFLVQSTRGPLEFTVLEVTFRGPSGPILLWIGCFLAVSFVILAALRLL
jgi:hypothetical protein